MYHISHKDKVEVGHEINAVNGVRCFAREWCHPERTESRLGLRTKFWVLKYSETVELNQ